MTENHESSDRLKALEMQADTMLAELSAKERSRKSSQQINTEIIEKKTVQIEAAAFRGNKEKASRQPRLFAFLLLIFILCIANFCVFYNAICH